jgi:hypothetical protein
MKILFFILAGGGLMHEANELAQRQTWAMEDSALFQVIWLRSHSEDEFRLQDRTLFVPCEPSFDAILEKTILGTNWATENIEFDYLIRSNTSTYFNVDSILKNLNKIHDNEVGGAYETNRKQLSSFAKGFRYLNGSGLYMNRRSALTLSSLDPSDYLGSPDDLALFDFLRVKGFRFLKVPRNNLDLHHIFVPFPQVRVKSWSNPGLTVNRMHLVHRYFQSMGFFSKLICWLEIEINEVRNSSVNFSGLLNLLNRNLKFVRKK